MTSWVLITMLCTRVCQPVYAEVFTDKQACMALVKPTKAFEHRDTYCVPLIVTKKGN